MKNNHSIVRFAMALLIAVCLVNSSGLRAQTDLDPQDPSDPSGSLGSPTPDSGGPDDPGVDPGTPVDGGLSLLLAAGVGYGANRLRKYRQKNGNAEK